MTLFPGPVWRGDGVAERAGLENRRWGNLSASSNLALVTADLSWQLSPETPFLIRL